MAGRVRASGVSYQANVDEISRRRQIHGVHDRADGRRCHSGLRAEQAGTRKERYQIPEHDGIKEQRRDYARRVTAV